MHDHKPNDKLNKKMGRILFFSMFSSYFFHMFAPLFWIGIALSIAGIFYRPLLIVGGIFLLLDLILTVFFMNRFKKMHSDHPEFERLRNAFNEGTVGDELNKLTDEWGGRGFYAARIGILKENAASCKTVGEAFDVYEKHCLAVVTGLETYLVNLGADEKYFADDGRYYVISFDRMREINDDIECHMYFDLLYDPEKVDLPEKSFSSEGIESQNVKEFFETVREYLKENNLFDMPVGKMNIGTDEEAI